MSEESPGRPADKKDPERTAVSPPRGRVFGDAEVARILETAADLQERSDALPTRAGHGLTLEDLRQVAQEAGIDPPGG